MAWNKNEKSSKQWANWSAWRTQAEAPLGAPRSTIHDTMSQTFEAYGNLANFDPMQLFLGVNRGTGAIETMSMSKPRSFILHGRDFFTSGILQSITLSTRLRANQKKMPITIISDDYDSWTKVLKDGSNARLARNDDSNVRFARTSSCYAALRELPDNGGKSPHFLVIDDLPALARLAAQPKSVLDFLITRGAESCGVYVLASYGPITNYHVENTLRSWLSRSNHLKAEAVGESKIRVHESTLYVPKP